MQEPISIFNIGERQEELNAAMFREKPQASNVFDPKLDKVTDSIAFIIRPMPYVNDVTMSTVSKNFYVLDDAAGKVWFDSRTTFNRPADNKYEFCEVSDLWFRLRQSKDPSVQALAQNLRLQRSNYCYVQILNYPADPSMNGQIVPMLMPMDMVKFFASMAKPSEQELKLGTKPVQPFDLYKGKNIKCVITGKMSNDGKTIWREWKFETPDPACEAMFPLGPNGSWLPISQLPQDAVLNYFKEKQTVDLNAVYGYHEPVFEVKRRVKNILCNMVAHVPGLCDVAKGYFPEVDAQMQNDPNAQQVAQPIAGVGEGIPMPGQPGVIQAGNPMNPMAGQQAAPAPQPATQPAPQPVQQAPQPAPGTQIPADQMPPTAQPGVQQPIAPAPGTQLPGQQPIAPAPGTQLPGQ
jgi:hypothetical protein